jgi:hypothetical protein
MGTQPLSDPSNPDHVQWHRDHVLDGLPKPELTGPAAPDGPAPATPPPRCPSLSDPSHPDHLAWQAAHTASQVQVDPLPDPAVTAALLAEADAAHEKPKRATKKAVKKAPAAKKAPAKKAAKKVGVKKIAR